jgi:hypothetical protein
MNISSSDRAATRQIAKGDPAMREADTKGWFVSNVSELRWQENELGATCEFDKPSRAVR